MKEITVISGKGGTGKTSLVASFAAQAGSVVTADCDVDAADLHLLLEPSVQRTVPFSGGKIASIIPDLCNGCGTCAELCRYGAVERDPDNDIYAIDKIACEGCGVCAYFCTRDAISFEDEQNGEWYVSSTRFGPMTHARLLPGGENSGKLVTTVRAEAKRLAAERGIDLVLIDGSPGIGCPVIASVTGADLADCAGRRNHTASSPNSSPPRRPRRRMRFSPGMRVTAFHTTRLKASGCRTPRERSLTKSSTVSQLA